MADFETAVALTLQNEGGFSHNPKTGEVVNRGITLKFLRDVGILKSSGPTLQSDIDFVQSLTLEETKDIYFAHFWDNNKLDQLDSQPVANKTFDLQVNTGHGVLFLQRAVNELWVSEETSTPLVVDGIVGPKTIAVVNDCCNTNAVALLGHRTIVGKIGVVPGSGIRGLAEQYYNSIPDPGGARPDWLRRLDL